MRGEAPDLAARTEYEITLAGRFARLTGQELWPDPDEQDIRHEVERRMLAGHPVDPPRIAQIRDAATPRSGMWVTGSSSEIQQVLWDIDRQRQVSGSPLGTWGPGPRPGSMRPTNQTAAEMDQAGRHRILG